MQIRFPGEPAEYRTARDRLLERETELRRAMEAVAVARRVLPPGGAVPEDYVFAADGPDGMPIQVRLSELFTPGKDSLVIYNFMFPRGYKGPRPGPASGETALCRWKRARARPALRCWISSTAPQGMSAGGSISPSWRRPRWRA